MSSRLDELEVQGENNGGVIRRPWEEEAPFYLPIKRGTPMEVGFLLE